MPEPSARLERELVEPREEPPRRIERLHLAMAAGELGLHHAGVKDGNRDALRLEIHGERLARHVERRLAHAIAVRTARAVVVDRAHATRDEAYLRAAPRASTQRWRDEERRQRVDLELLLDRRGVECVERLRPGHDARVVDEQIDRASTDGGDELLQRRILRDLDAAHDFRTGPLELR